MNEKIKGLTENIAGGYIKLNDVTENIDIEDLKKAEKFCKTQGECRKNFFL